MVVTVVTVTVVAMTTVSAACQSSSTVPHRSACMRSIPWAPHEHFHENSDTHDPSTLSLALGDGRQPPHRIKRRCTVHDIFLASPRHSQAETTTGVAATTAMTTAVVVVVIATMIVVVVTAMTIAAAVATVAMIAIGMTIGEC